MDDAPEAESSKVDQAKSDQAKSDQAKSDQGQPATPQVTEGSFSLLSVTNYILTVFYRELLDKGCSDGC